MESLLIALVWGWQIIHATMDTTGALRDRPAPFRMADLVHPLTKSDLQRRESLKAYAQGLLCERDDRLLKAAELYEKAAKLDPTETAARLKLITLYGTFDRPQDASAICREILDRDPANSQVWLLLAKQHQRMRESPEAIAALKQALKNLTPASDHQLAYEVYYTLASVQQESNHTVPAAQAFAKAAECLQQLAKELTLDTEGLDELRAKIAGLYERSARLYAEAKQPDAAFEAYKLAQKAHPVGQYHWDLNLAEMAVARGKDREAMVFLDRYLQHMPQHAAPYQLKIQLMEKLNQGADIIPFLERAVAKDRYNRGLRMLLAEQYGRRGRTLDAERTYLQIAELSPTKEVYQGLLQLFQKAGGNAPHRALALFDQTLKRAWDKDHPVDASTAKTQARAMLSAVQGESTLAIMFLDAARSQRAQQSPLQFDTLHLLAAIAEQQRRPADAERFYRAALSSESTADKTLAYSGLFRVLWSRKKYKDIVTICKAALREANSPSPVLLHSTMARALAQLRQPTAALQQCDEALSLAQGDEKRQLQLLRIRILTQAGEYDTAERECKALLEEKSFAGEVATVRFLLSYIYTGSRNFQKAEEQLQLVIASDPSNATAHNDLGYLLADQGKNLDEAERLIRRALELDRLQRQTFLAGELTDPQENAALVDSLGWLLFRQGKYQQAREQLEKASRLPNGEDPVIWQHLGDVYHRLEMFDQAIQAWRRALMLYEHDASHSREERMRELERRLKLLERTG